MHVSCDQKVTRSAYAMNRASFNTKLAIWSQCMRVCVTEGSHTVVTSRMSGAFRRYARKW